MPQSPAQSARVVNPGGMIMFKSFIAILALAGFVAGCNTMEGAGKDIKEGGQKIEDSAQKHKDSN